MAFSGAFVKPFRPEFDAGLAAAGNGLLTNLVAHWKLDEASGNRADSHGTNTTIPNIALSNRTGKIDSAVNLAAGVTNWLYIASPATNLRVAAGTSFSASMWVWLDAWPAASSFPFSRWDVTYTDWYFAIAPSGAVQCGVAATATTEASTPISAVTTGAWYHIVGWMDHTIGANGTVYVQVNGGTVYSTALASAHVSAVAARAFIGCINYGGYGTYDGAIDEVAFWNRVLTATQRSQLYNAGAGLAYAAFTT